MVNFVTLNLRCKKIIDLATGNAPIPMLLFYKTKASIDCVEFQKCIYDLACKSVCDNGMDNRISVINGDVRKISEYYSSEQKVLVTQLKSLIEPILIVSLAIIVGIILFSVILPMFTMYEGIL